MFEGLFNKIVLGAGSLLGFLFGQYDLPFKILMTLMILDFATGIFRGFKTKTLNSTKCRTGLYGKIGVFALLILACMIDLLLGLDGMTRTAIIFFYIVSESISILENIAQLGVPIPQVLLDALEKAAEIGGKPAEMDTSKKDELLKEEKKEIQ